MIDFLKKQLLRLNEEAECWLSTKVFNQLVENIAGMEMTDDGESIITVSEGRNGAQIVYVTNSTLAYNVNGLLKQTKVHVMRIAVLAKEGVVEKCFSPDNKNMGPGIIDTLE